MLTFSFDLIFSTLNDVLLNFNSTNQTNNQTKTTTI
jgi:hypothetical protein